MSDPSFFLLQFLVHVDIGNEAMVIDGIEGDVDLSMERIGVGEGGKIYGAGNQWEWMRSHERSGH